MLSNAYFLAKFRFDTAENEPAKNLQNFRKMHFRKMRAHVGHGVGKRRIVGRPVGSSRTVEAVTAASAFRCPSAAASAPGMPCGLPLSAMASPSRGVTVRARVKRGY